MDVKTDIAGVGWVLAENRWPYQRPSFVTPPFSGYVSGHSTFSRAAAEVMTLITGDEFFPGGMGEFIAKKDEFLVFEKGPSVEVKLQWATYRDASDQTSLSRIWGGIHPPADDIPGRLIGEKIGINAYNFAVPYFNKNKRIVDAANMITYPNPIIENKINIANSKSDQKYHLFDINGKEVFILSQVYDAEHKEMVIMFSEKTPSGIYVLKSEEHSQLIMIKN